VRELGELAGADVTAHPDEVELDPLTRTALERAPDRATQKKVEILQEFSRRAPGGKPKRLVMRFLVSPVELVDDGRGGVTGMRLVRNRLYATATGTLQPKATDQLEELPIGLVFRSVGYRGVPLPGVPFNEAWGVILNEKGRVLDAETKQPLVGQYTAGWIKRGPTGVIGTNKPDAVETVTAMLEDLARDIHLRPADTSPESVERLVRERQPQYLSYRDWRRLDEIETARGKETGRPRVKFTRVKDMLAALGRA
jgi:ferredoxin--NADP+ reductase